MMQELQISFPKVGWTKVMYIYYIKLCSKRIPQKSFFFHICIILVHCTATNTTFQFLFITLISNVTKENNIEKHNTRWSSTNIDSFTMNTFS